MASTIKQDRPIKHVKSADFREIYTNNLRMGMTPVDLVIWFGHIVESNESTDTYIEENVAVRFSPHLFKILTETLSGALEVYERRFGEIEIKDPPSPEEEKSGIVQALGLSNQEPHPRRGRKKLS
jgi:Protein of unknown function (DUF3467)